jgi:protein ImuA
MSGARTTMLATLRGRIAVHEAYGGAERPERVALGHAEADASLQGGLIRGALHEVFAAEGRHCTAATGFVAGLAGRIGRRRPLLWIRHDLSALEAGALSLSGWAELGLDPRLVVTVRAATPDVALRVAADALACDALGVVVLDIWGEARPFDLVASRKLTLAAQASGVTGVMLRAAAMPQPSTAETRWIVRAAHSPPAPSWCGWGAPLFDAELVRNRHGPVGRFVMEWKSDECLFAQPLGAAADSQPVAAAPGDRPHPAAARSRARAS